MTTYQLTQEQLIGAFMKYLKDKHETPGKTVLMTLEGKPIYHAAKDEAKKLISFVEPEQPDLFATQ